MKKSTQWKMVQERQQKAKSPSNKNGKKLAERVGGSPLATIGWQNARERGATE